MWPQNLSFIILPPLHLRSYTKLPSTVCPWQLPFKASLLFCAQSESQAVAQVESWDKRFQFQVSQGRELWQTQQLTVVCWLPKLTRTPWKRQSKALHGVAWWKDKIHRAQAEENELLRLHIRKSLFPMGILGQISQRGYDVFALGGSQDLTGHSPEQPGVTLKLFLLWAGIRKKSLWGFFQ